MHSEIERPLRIPRAPFARLVAALRDYVALTKPRIISLLLFVTLAVMMIAAGKAPSLRLVLLTLVGGALMSGAANVLNCFLDRDIDRVMSRTRNRPLVTGAISPAQALVFGLALAAAACAILGLGVNLLSGLLALGGLLVYVLVYTPSKRVTPWSVLIGAIAGASPALTAWAAVTGSLDRAALLLFAIMALWQVPHTLALSVMLYSDYARANVPVSPVAHGIGGAQREIVAYSVLLWAVSLTPVLLGTFGVVYGLGATLLGGQFLGLSLNSVLPRALRTVRARNDTRLYRYSLLYLALLFTLMTADRLMR